MTDAQLSDDGATLTVWIPMTFRTRGGRKLVVSPDGVPTQVQPRSRVDDTLVKALARAFRWRKLLETGVHGTVDEIARAEGINRFLREPHPAPHLARAGHRRGDPRRPAAASAHPGEADEAVSGGMGTAARVDSGLVILILPH